MSNPQTPTLATYATLELGAQGCTAGIADAVGRFNTLIKCLVH